MKKLLIKFVLVLALVAIVVPPMQEAGSTCCTDSAVLKRGIQATYSALLVGASDDAMQILRKTAAATGTELPK